MSTESNAQQFRSGNTGPSYPYAYRFELLMETNDSFIGEFLHYDGKGFEERAQEVIGEINRLYPPVISEFRALNRPLHHEIVTEHSTIRAYYESMLGGPFSGVVWLSEAFSQWYKVFVEEPFFTESTCTWVSIYREWWGWQMSRKLKDTNEFKLQSQAFEQAVKLLKEWSNFIIGINLRLNRIGLTSSEDADSSLGAPPNKEEPTDEELKAIVRRVLSPLNGQNPQRQKIMSYADYTRLLDYVDDLVLNNIAPSQPTKITQTGISNEHIRYTLYRLHVELFTTQRVRQTFIDLIHEVFKQFDGTTRTTTRRKFGTPPKSYFKDFAGYIGEAP